ncbi:TPA: GNAT family N-acetyltransferase [Streptococcus pyogenes]|uniref:GNAT family N-acetyltransferase n=1 Tax=Streptococcus pyogenes TaxID=1314 RepID=UPI00109D50A5|nr:GNAT family N-acetyltransferase [Streptococcus pyogenes]VHE45328.1 acetyltransferase family protein [Streptococcus pyogenes]HEP1536920.1 GNAT family N-acetyltransferase [Streptococcus pyogenes]
MLIRQVQGCDLEVIATIESDNFSPQEATTRAVLEERIRLIPDTFLVALIDQEIVGYIEGPVVTTPILEDSLFHGVTKNPKTGGYIAITSLSIAKHFQQQGVGTALLAALKDLVVAQQRTGLILTCHDYLISYYEMNGFINQGISESQHGGTLWYQMIWKL